MSTHLTIRSPLATLASLSNTAFWAALLLVAAVGIRRVQEGSDVILVYALPVIALVLVLLPLRVRVSLGSEGVAVHNLFIAHRIPWDEIDAVIVERLPIDVLWRLSFSVPGVVFRHRAGLDAEAYATWGLRRARRRDLAAALTAAATQYGFRCEVDANGLALRRGQAAVAEPGAGEHTSAQATVWDDEAWSDELREQAGAEVECVACGRRAEPSEMEPFGEEGEAVGWYCSDVPLCEERQRDSRAERDVRTEPSAD